MAAYSPIGTGYQGIPTFGRPKETITVRGGARIQVPIRGAGMVQVSGQRGSALDQQKANGPGRYMGGNAESAIAANPSQPASGTQYDSSSIGYDQYHNLFHNKGGFDKNTGKYTTGELAGMSSDQARSWSQQGWLNQDQAGRDKFVQKAAPLFGRPITTGAGTSAPTTPPVAGTTVAANKPMLPPTNYGSTASTLSSLGVTTPPKDKPMMPTVGTMTTPKALNMLGVATGPTPAVAPMPPKNNDPALAKRLQAGPWPKKPTVLDKGQPWISGQV